MQILYMVHICSKQPYMVLQRLPSERIVKPNILVYNGTYE